MTITASAIRQQLRRRDLPPPRAMKKANELQQQGFDWNGAHRLFSWWEAAYWLGVSEAEVAELVRRGALRYIEGPTHWGIPAWQLERLERWRNGRP